jgi:hypothetical protein
VGCRSARWGLRAVSPVHVASSLSFGSLLVKACAEQGTHYTNITGEVWGSAQAGTHAAGSLGRLPGGVAPN